MSAPPTVATDQLAHMLFVARGIMCECQQWGAYPLDHSHFPGWRYSKDTASRLGMQVVCKSERHPVAVIWAYDFGGDNQWIIVIEPQTLQVLDSFEYVTTLELLARLDRLPGGWVS